ncbi:MAG TPA: RNA polymerase sigma factor RpoD/SigA [Fibrobacteria bacterium]|nr:RNA polymerase sigma factor RpoD/SigA [Fibrobacteria bacterium]
MGKDAVRGASGRNGDQILKAYLEDIRKIAQVPGHLEGALFRLFRKGSARAREHLIAANMRFVVKVALEYRACPMPMGDLIGEGSIGLIHAVETFDPGRGVKFISYAVWWIRSYITKALNEKGYLIRLPANQYFRLRKALQAERYGRLEDEDLRVIRQLSQGCSSLDAPQPGSGMPWSDALPNRAAPDPSLQAELSLGARLTERMLASLSERERKVVKGFYGLEDENPVTLKEVGIGLNLSAERVRQIRKQAIRKIRKDPAAAPLRDRYECLLRNQFV